MLFGRYKVINLTLLKMIGLVKLSGSSCLENQVSHAGPGFLGVGLGPCRETSYSSGLVVSPEDLRMAWCLAMGRSPLCP